MSADKTKARRAKCRGCIGLLPSLVSILAALVTVARADGNPYYTPPRLEPIPTSVEGVKQAIISLDGTWKLSLAPPADFNRDELDTSSWKDSTVPAPFVQSLHREEQPYVLRTVMTVPSEFAGFRVILHFGGVSNAARVWVGGKEAGSHWGTFMAWTRDITDLVKPGQKSSLVVLIDDRPIGLAQFVRPGGIVRDVELFAIPVDHLSRLQAEATFDSSYVDAKLHLRLRAELGHGESITVRMSLSDADGKSAVASDSSFTISDENPEVTEAISVAHPQKWDAEHPKLYTLKATVSGAGGVGLETLTVPFGFREVKVVGNRMMVNGREIKLRGIWGNRDVGALKDINVNHSRQKYVPESFLQDADRLGLYVTDEVPIDFAKYGVESDPAAAGEWLGLIADLIERDRNHPSVIMWGLGNESFNGPNVLKTFKYAQAEDSQRPAMFSWANRVPVDQELPYSIYSSHYPDLNDHNLDLGDYDVAKWHSPSLVRLRRPKPSIPVVHDEYAHVILNEALIIRDPNVRNFWGESIYRYWEKMFVTPGALGGDQFGMGLRLGRGNLPNGPEYYLLKEAYSPVRIANRPLANPGDGQPLAIELKNWYDHTNLAELRVDWTVNGTGSSMPGPSVEPHGDGKIVIPARQWRDGDIVDLRFVENSGRLANEFQIRINPPPALMPFPRGPAPALLETSTQFVISGPNFRIVFDKARGLMSEASVGGKNTIIDGPFLTLLGSGLAYGEWWCDRIEAHSEGKEVVVDIKGNYAVIAATFQVRVDGSGLITTHYCVDHVPGLPPPATFSPWNATSVGGYSEVGLSYVLPVDVNRLSWQRNALWSVYPDDHMGRPAGTARREPSTTPDAAWSRLEDPAGSGSNDWRGMKENIIAASAWAEASGVKVEALSNGSASVRLAIDPGYRALKPGVRLLIDNEWNYEDFGLGNYTRPPLLIHDGYENVVYMKIGSQ